MNEIEEVENETMGKKIIKELVELLKIFVVCFIIIYLLTTFVMKPIRVEGSSMYPTLKDREIGITNVFGARFIGVSRFDVVIVHNEERDEHWVKRVIGLPRDTIEGKNDQIYINGEVIEQSFFDEAYIDEFQQSGLFTTNFGPITLGEDEYFLMGDNRIRSEDSRVHGPFKKSEIVGKDVLILFPFNEFKFVRNTGE